MREVVYRNLTSITSRKKDIMLKEVFEKDGVVAKTERRCLYCIRDIIHFEKPEDMQKWVYSQNGAKSLDARQFHFFKRHSDSLGQDALICKIIGTFFVIVENTIYTIAFLHSFKVHFLKMPMIQ